MTSTTCKHCHKPMAAKGPNNISKTFCGPRCNGDYRKALNAAKRAEQEARAEVMLERNTAGLQTWMAHMHASAEKQRRRAAVMAS